MDILSLEVCSGENSSQFDIWPHGTDDLTTYDYDSVMHYWDDGRNCYSVFRKCNNSYANCPYGGYSIDARIIYRNTTAKLSPKTYKEFKNYTTEKEK